MATPAFKSATRRNRTALSDQQFTQAGQILRVDLPQVGYLAYLYVMCFGQIITNATASPGTWDPNYWPMNLFKRIRVSSNEGLELYNTDGYVNSIIAQTEHIGTNLIQQGSAIGNNKGTSGAQTAVSSFPTGALAISTTYNVLLHYFIPIVTDYDLRAGLVLLQNQATRASVELTLGQVTDWGITAAANVASISITARAVMEFFSVPADPNAQPDTSFIHRWIQDQIAWTASGDQTYKVPVNGVISRVIALWQTGASPPAPQAMFSTPGNPTTPNYNNFTVQYAGSQKPEIMDFRTQVMHDRLFYAQDFPDGVFLFEFSLGQGSVEAGWDGRDVYDTSQLTEFALIQNTGVTPAAGANIRMVREELQRRAA